MLIALLIAPGVDLAVVMVVAAFVFGRRRWPSGMKQLGDKPVVMEFAAGAARIEVAARAQHSAGITRLATMNVT